MRYENLQFDTLLNNNEIKIEIHHMDQTNIQRGDVGVGDIIKIKHLLFTRYIYIYF